MTLFHFFMMDSIVYVDTILKVSTLTFDCDIAIFIVYQSKSKYTVKVGLSPTA